MEISEPIVACISDLAFKYAGKSPFHCSLTFKIKFTRRYNNC